MWIEHYIIPNLSETEKYSSDKSGEFIFVYCNDSRYRFEAIKISQNDSKKDCVVIHVDMSLYKRNIISKIKENNISSLNIHDIVDSEKYAQIPVEIYNHVISSNQKIFKKSKDIFKDISKKYKNWEQSDRVLPVGCVEYKEKTPGVYHLAHVTQDLFNKRNYYYTLVKIVYKSETDCVVFYSRYNVNASDIVSEQSSVFDYGVNAEFADQYYSYCGWMPITEADYNKINVAVRESYDYYQGWLTSLTYITKKANKVI